jgi:DNA-binding PadR family transcriptional regulator
MREPLTGANVLHDRSQCQIGGFNADPVEVPDKQTGPELPKIGSRLSPSFLLLSQWKCGIVPVGNQNGDRPTGRSPREQNEFERNRRRRDETENGCAGLGDLLAVNQGPLYPALLKLEQEGAVKSDWGASENTRRARFYLLTSPGRKQLQTETREWEQTAAIIARFFEVTAEDL